MPLQQINLDQSIYNKPKDKWGGGRRPGSVVSEALQPQQGGGGGGFAAAGGNMPNSFVEEQKAIWAEEDKLKKAERDAELMKAQEIGMRVQDEAKKKQETTMAQIKQQQVAKQQIEADPEPAAKEMYELMKTLPDDAKQVLLQQIFKPTGTGGFIQAGGVKKDMPDKYNPLANVFLQKGWATFDEKGNVNLSEPEREFEKATFEIVEKGGKVYKHNTATGEEIEIGSTAEPEGTVNEIVKQIRSDAIEAVKADPSNETKLEDAMYDAGLDYGLSEEESLKIAKFTEMPEGEKKKSKFREWWDKVITSRIESGFQTQGLSKVSAAAKPTFKEDNVSALVPIISDDVTPAERAHLKTQGASDSDIDEAIKRKVK